MGTKYMFPYSVNPSRREAAVRALGKGWGWSKQYTAASLPAGALSEFQVHAFCGMIVCGLCLVEEWGKAN